MRKSLLFFIGLFSQVLFGQGQPPTTGASGKENMSFLNFEFPEISPASPTVASLMRFEEIPVNAYTGIPDISIPIYSFKTRSSKVNLDLSLNYHATGIGAEEIAAYTGLGWSLLAGGSISRTVRGYPDEIIQHGGAFRGAKYGIYYRAGNVGNYYYEVEDNRINSASINQTKLQEFKWDSYEKGMYDTEHDLYQYNFMGISGRFYLRLNTSTNKLEVVRLDNNTQYKIAVSHSDLAIRGRALEFNRFTITDNNGIQYVFEEQEIVEKQEVNTNTYYFGNYSFDFNNSTTDQHPNAFHLKKVLDEYGAEIIHFNYTPRVEKTISKQTTVNSTETNIGSLAGGNGGLEDSYSGVYESNMQRAEPERTVATTIQETLTKKLSSIFIHDMGSVHFTVGGARTDTNLPVDNGAVKLEEIIIKDNKGNQIKKFEFNYSNFTVRNYQPENISNATNRLERSFLREVKEYGRSNNVTPLKYTLRYEKEDNNFQNVIKNPWGYFELENNGLEGKKFNTIGVLHQMDLPTGGMIQFDFEPNTYSYNGKILIDDFSGNPENNGLSPSSSNWKKYLYGGGIRINKISFYDSKTASLPATIKAYEYTYFNDQQGKTSSGSLVFTAPIYEFLFGKETVFEKAGGNHHPNEDGVTIYYTSKTTFNNLSFIRSQGTDVGYQHVKIKDINPKNPTQILGKTENTYRAPQEFPEFYDENYPEEDEFLAISYPFIPLRNYDYSRGQLKESRIYDNNILLQQTTNEYKSLNTKNETTGLKLSIDNGGGCGKAYLHNNFVNYKIKFDQWSNSNSHSKEICTQDKLFGNPASHIRIYPIQEASGWTQLTKTITHEFFQNSNTIETIQEFTYNDLNKQIQTQTVHNSLGKKLKTEYKYPQDLLNGYEQSTQMSSLVDQNRISAPIISKTYHDNTPTSEQRTFYDDFSNKLFPKYVYTKKGANTTVNDKRITYNRYNSYGNLEQYTLENGIPVSIIWGYNEQYPIAKIEGATYSQISSQAQILSGLSNSGSLNETSFETLRKMENVMVTGYIYKPLVGVTAVIQPNGQVEHYEYDNFGRLEYIKDHNGKVIKRMEYHYKN